MPKTPPSPNQVRADLKRVAEVLDAARKKKDSKAITAAEEEFSRLTRLLPKPKGVGPRWK
jgi:hypothetical protein